VREREREREIWCLTLRDEHRTLRKIFGPKRDEVIGGWGIFQNEEAHNFYSWPNVITMSKSMRIRWTGHLARRVEKKNAYKISVGKPERKRPLGRLRHT
jgi:hypothetical protein